MKNSLSCNDRSGPFISCGGILMAYSGTTNPDFLNDALMCHGSNTHGWVLLIVICNTTCDRHFIVCEQEDYIILAKLPKQN